MSDRPQNPLDADVEDDLGAAPTLPGSRSRDKADGGAGDGGAGGDGGTRSSRRRPSLPKVGGRIGVAAIAVLIVLLALVPAVASTLEKTPRDKYGISYGGGPIEGAHFQKTVAPGSALFFNGLFDDLFLYPADQQTYATGPSDDEDTTTGGPIVAPSKDQVNVTYQVAVYFKLDTDQLRAFHEQIGLNYSAYTDSGWDQMINSVFRPQIDNALQEQTRRFDVADLFADAEVLKELQTEVGANLSSRLEAALGQRFFCSPAFEPGAECQDPTFIIKSITIPETVQTAFERNRQSEIDVVTRQNEAEAIQALSDALGPDQYPLLKAIESGQITFWVLPDGGITVAAPDGSGAAPAAPEGGG
jgi:regulator of protease activity HflC (stomatin/prohibitin superfamily)